LQILKILAAGGIDEWLRKKERRTYKWQKPILGTEGKLRGSCGLGPSKRRFLFGQRTEWGIPLAWEKTLNKGD